jgi:Spy/CpxP family protein refolding chaperone
MKRILFLFALIFSAGIANAQSSETPVTPAAERAHSSAMRMQKTLALTEEQRTQIEAIILQRINAIEVIKADASKTQEQKDTEIAQVRTQKEQEMLAVMTPDQVTKYNEMKAQRQQRRDGATQDE